MSKRLNRRVVLLVCGLFVLGVVFAFALAAQHGGHCCHPQTCAVCHQIQAVRALLRQLVLALGILFALALSRLGANRAPGGFTGLPARHSPVALKVRMNN